MFDKLELALQDGHKSDINKAIKKIKAKNSTSQTIFDIALRCLTHSRWVEGVEQFRQAIRCNASLIQNTGTLLSLNNVAENFDVQFDLVEAALAIQPENCGLNISMGSILARKENFDRAEAYIQKAITIGSDNVNALVTLSHIYYQQSRYHDVIACCQILTELDPGNVRAYFHRALAYQDLYRFTEAVDDFKKAIALSPRHQGAHINLANLMLKLGNFDAGWLHYNWRWENPNVNSLSDKIPFPEWTGESLEGKSILVWADQGVGDVIMFSSFLPRLKALGASISVIADIRLEALFRRSFSIDNYYGFTSDQSEVKFKVHDYHIAFGTLPARFIHSFEDFSKGGAYLQPDLESVSAYQKSLRSKFQDKKLIGFSWRGGIAATRKFSRNIEFDLWSDLFQRQDCQFINLQYDTTPEERKELDRLGVITPDFDLKNDIDALAACLSAIDLLISMDNSTVHLAGALGTRVWNLLPYSSEWRWFLEEEHCYWYDSMRLIRAPSVEGWDDVMQSINQSLN